MQGTEQELDQQQEVAPAAKPTKGTGKKSQQEETFDEPVIAAATRTVGFTCIKDHKCHISGADYDVKAGKNYKIPSDVAHILATAGYGVKS
jgi:hypothetical protein